MEVLNADLIPVEDRVYRLIKVKNSLRNAEEERPPARIIRVGPDDEYDPDLPIMHEGNTFYITFHVPEQLFGCIIGKLGKTIKMIEQFGAKINIPEKGNKDAPITISGSSKKIVSDAYHRVMDRVNINRLKTESTHFVSFPTNASNIQKSFLKFKEIVLEKYSKVRGIDESIFQNPRKLHITVAVLVLLDERDKQNAIALLKKGRDNVLKNIGEKEFLVHVKGIEYMNDDPSEVDVLYAKVEEVDGDDSLQILSDNIFKEYANADLARKQNDKVKLHITLMNTLFRSRLETRNAEDELMSERMTFDARPLLEDFENFDFGQLVISDIHISVRYTEAPDGYFRAEHIMNMSP